MRPVGSYTLKWPVKALKRALEPLSHPSLYLGVPNPLKSILALFLLRAGHEPSGDSPFPRKYTKI